MRRAGNIQELGVAGRHNPGRIGLPSCLPAVSVRSGGRNRTKPDRVRAAPRLDSGSKTPVCCIAISFPGGVYSRSLGAEMPVRSSRKREPCLRG